MLLAERFPRLWHWGQAMFLVFPLLPIWGSLGLFIVAVIAIQKQWRELLKRPIFWGLGGMPLWLIITSITAHDPQRAWLGTANFIPFFVVFLGISLLVETPTQLRRLAWLAVASGVVISILGIGQITLGWIIPEQGWLGWGLDKGGDPSQRLASIFMYANITAAYLLVVFTLTMGLWVENYRWRKQQWWQWLGLTVAILIIAIALILTSSRNAWGGAFLVTLAFVIYLRWYEILAVIGMGVAAITGAAFAPSPIKGWLRQVVPRYFWARLNDQQYGDRAVETLRITQWEFSWNLTQQRPIFGWGLRNFSPLYQAQTETWLGHPHNLPLMLSAEIGIPGALLFVGLIGSAIARATMLLRIWSKLAPIPSEKQWQQDKLMLLTFILAFCALSVFNLLDVTLFDLRTNLLGWLLLAGIDGVTHYHRNFFWGIKLMS